MRKDWTPERKSQYRSLQILIDNCKYLNNGTGAIDTLNKIIKTADSLSGWDASDGGVSFMHFLTEELNK